MFIFLPQINRTNMIMILYLLCVHSGRLNLNKLTAIHKITSREVVDAYLHKLITMTIIIILKLLP